ncbi:thiamine phosphate synthase [Aquibacillus salsiterrae]|uniref:Thiamine-phosphate synthase n=1 Tax=Aquibacillus salsiterrae TaxID=2950439 RepID=A0A9X3WIG9_9BACI|nr:thiamine phosphate synthase [Aquibacillus salsiterrae]MDC3418064.1 thiamine phosphate synthase [Aquibacillus salsiterrae]
MITSLKEKLKLYFVMGSSNCKQDPRYVLREAIEGGVTMYQFREKGDKCITGQIRLGLAKDLQRICKDNGVPFIVNDDVDLAMEIDADGVHIGQEDQPIENVRTIIGEKILGVSAHTMEEANIAVQKGADYLGVGPMYRTTTKSDIREVQGPKVINQMRSCITIPIVGIGGIDESRVKEVIRNGADGVAVISAISQSTSPRLAARYLSEKL